jgi:signal transduction histidine kinase
MKLNKMRFDIVEAIFRTIISFEQKIEDKQLDIRGAEEMEAFFVDGDPDLLGQVIYNLFENAVKFVNVGGYIELQTYENKGYAHFRIRNSGAGVEPDELKLLFERFYKTDRSRSLDKTGIGLGLYIVKTIVTLHGGDITARSVVGEYCEFEFSIPVISGTTELSLLDRK